LDLFSTFKDIRVQ
jgi:hypothetical protein